MNTQTRLNQLMSFQENLKQKISNLPEGELCIYQSPSYQNGYAHYLGSRNTYLKKSTISGSPCPEKILFLIACRSRRRTLPAQFLYKIP